MKQHSFLLILSLVLVGPFSLHANDIQPGKKFVYKHSAGKPREMEIYFPPNHDPAKDKVPGVILFHGGGWSSGSLTTFRRDCQYFASRGLVAATANYRMLTKAERKKLPKGKSNKSVCVTDGKSAIRWFKQNAPELGIDPDRVITGGGSAGGHISVLASLDGGVDDPKDPKDIDTSVVAYILYNPAFAGEDTKHPKIDATKFIKKEMAPAIAIYGTKDPWLKRAEPVYTKLDNIGNTTTELWYAEGKGHAFFNKEPWKSATILAADQFLVRQGLLKGEPTLSLHTKGAELFPASAEAKKKK